MFDANEQYTKESRQLMVEVTDAIGPIIKKWVALGYKIRDIESVIHGEVAMILIEELLGLLDNDGSSTDDPSPEVLE